MPHLNKPLTGLVIFGAPPFSGVADMGIAFNPVAEFSVMLTADPEPEGINAFFNVSIANSRISHDDFIRDFNHTDPAFRGALGKSVQEERIADEVKILVSSHTSTAIFNGELDPFINVDYMDSLLINKWRNKVHIIPGAGHYPQVEQPEKFNALLAGYIGDILV